MKNKFSLGLGLLVFGMVLALFSIIVSVQAQETRPKTSTVTVSDLVGAWHLERVEGVRGDKVGQPFGSSVSGTLVYMPNGQMVVAWGRQDRAAPKDMSKTTPEEAAGIIKGFDAYWGTFEVDSVRGIVIHHVKGCLQPSVIGTDRIRNVSLVGDMLTLALKVPCPQCAPGEEAILRLVWIRSR
jgi:hypothetical protein